MKKKIISLASIGLALLLASCSSGSANNTNTTDNTGAASTLISSGEEDNTTSETKTFLDIKYLTIKSKEQIDSVLGTSYTIGINYGKKSVSSAGVVSYGQSSVTKVNETTSYTKIATTKTSSISLEYYYSENGTYYEYNSSADLFNKLVKTEDVYQNGAWDIISATFGKTVPYTSSEKVNYIVDDFVRQATLYHLDASLTNASGSLVLDFIIDDETGIPLEYAFDGSSSNIKLEIGKTQFSVLNINIGEPDFSDAPIIAVETYPRDTLLEACCLDNFFELPKEGLNALECTTKWTKKDDQYVNTGFEGIYDNITYEEAYDFCTDLFKEEISYKTNSSSSSAKAANAEECFKKSDSELKVIEFDIFYRTNELSGSVRTEGEVKVLYSETNGLTITITDK